MADSALPDGLVGMKFRNDFDFEPILTHKAETLLEWLEAPRDRVL